MGVCRVESAARGQSEGACSLGTRKIERSASGRRVMSWRAVRAWEIARVPWGELKGPGKLW